MTMLFLAWLLLQVLCCFWAGEAAKQKGLHDIGWMLLGLLFGPFALLALCAMPDLKSQRFLKLMAKAQGIDVGDPQPSEQAAINGISDEELEAKRRRIGR